MRRKRRPDRAPQEKSQKKGSIGPPSLTSEEESFVTSLLQDIKDVDPLEIVAKIPDSRLALALVDKLPLDTALPISLLSALKDGFDDKQVQKALKRTLFKLKGKGFSHEELLLPETRSPDVLKAPPKEEPVAKVGPLLDLSGTRAIMITFQRSRRGKDIGMGLVSDENGFQHFALATISKKRLRETEESLAQGAGPMVDTSVSHAATILEKAYQSHMERHPKAPEHYLDFRPWLLENASVRKTPMIYDLIDESAVSEEPLTNSRLQKLFHHTLMQSWIIEFEQLRPYLEEIQEADAGAIILTDAQKSDQVRRIKDKGMDELFPPSKRDSLKHRFEETAYIFWHLDREDLARFCLIAARSLAHEDSTFMKNSVIQFLMDRSIDFYTAAAGEDTGDEDGKDEGTPSIILP